MTFQAIFLGLPFTETRRVAGWACEVIGRQDLQRHGLGQDTIITHLTILRKSSQNSEEITKIIPENFFGLSWIIMD